MEGLNVELYNPSDCGNDDYIFTADNLTFGQYQVFDDVTVAEWVVLQWLATDSVIKQNVIFVLL